MSQFEEVLYFNCNTFDDMVSMTLGHLNGVTEETLSFMGQIEEETRPLLNNIVELNTYRFMTTESQPNASYDDEWQKAYVDGYMHRDLVDTFTEFMLTKSDFYYNIVSSKGQSTGNVPFENALDSKGKMIEMYPMTIQKPEGSTTWKNFTVLKNNPKLISKMVFKVHKRSLNPEMRDIFFNDYVHVVVVCKDWNTQNDPILLLIDFFKRYVQVEPLRLSYDTMNSVSNIIALLIDLHKKGLSDEEVNNLKAVVFDRAPLDFVAAHKVVELGLQKQVTSMMTLMSRYVE